MTPILGEIPSSTLVKGMNIGASGGGKTGALACLAKAGYRLFIYDFDKGCQILLDEKILPKEFRKNVIVREYVDKIVPTPSGPMFSAPPMAWMTFLKDLDNNPDQGPLKALGPKDIVVIDSLTFAGNCAMRFVANLAGRLNKTPFIQDWGQAMQMEEDLLAVLYSDIVPCNVIVNAHITYIGGNDGNANAVAALMDQAKAAKKDEAFAPLLAPLMDAINAASTSIRPEQGYPSALGSKLPPKVGRYFNTVVRTKSIGQGASVRRAIVTRSEDGIELKVPNTKIPQTLPVDTGWVEIFKTIQGG